MRAVHQFAVVVGVLLVLCPGTGRTEDKTDLKDDQKALQGKWQTEDKGTVRLIVEIIDNKVSFLGKRLAGNILVSGVSFELKEADKKRVIQLDAKAAKAERLNEKMTYRLDKDSLTLSIEDGLLKGEHKLKRVVKKTK